MLNKSNGNYRQPNKGWVNHNASGCIEDALMRRGFLAGGDSTFSPCFFGAL